MKTKRRGGRQRITRRGGKRKTKKSSKRRGRRSGQRGGGCASRSPPDCDKDYYKRIQGIGDTCRDFQRSSFHGNDCGYGLHQWRQHRWRHCRNPRGQDGSCRGAALTGAGSDFRGGESAALDVPLISPGSVIIHRSNTDIKTERARVAAERKAEHRTLAEEAARRRSTAERVTAELERRRQLALAEEQRQEAMMAERTRRAMEESRAAVAEEQRQEETTAIEEQLPGPQPTPVFKDETEHLFDGGLFGGGKRTRRRRRTRRGKR